MSSSKKFRGLGRGLDALMPKIPPPSASSDISGDDASSTATAKQGVQQIALSMMQVSPYQPRKHIDPEALAELSASIAEKGILQPLLLRPLATGNYEIVAGERRYRAALQAGLLSVPALLRELSDQETLEIAIIENLQREDLNPLEEARAFAHLMDFGLSQEAVAQAVGKSRSAVANALRLLKLPEDILEALARGDISAGHGRAILSLPAEQQHWALEHIISQQLSVRQSEALQAPQEHPQKYLQEQADIATPDSINNLTSTPTSSTWQYLADDLSRHVGSQVTFVAKKKDKGKLELHFHSQDELDHILNLLGYHP